MAINPRGQLPAFKDGSVVVNESFAAIIYLEEKYDSGTQLLPKDPAARALVSPAYRSQTVHVPARYSGMMLVSDSPQATLSRTRYDGTVQARPQTRRRRLSLISACETVVALRRVRSARVDR